MELLIVMIACAAAAFAQNGTSNQLDVPDGYSYKLTNGMWEPAPKDGGWNTFSHGDYLLVTKPTGLFLTSLTIGAGTGTVSINVQTGKITLSDGLTLDEAAKAFWEYVQSYAGAHLCKTEPQP